MRKYSKKIYNTIMVDELRILPGNIAFFLMLSIIPIITLIGFICSIFSLSLGDVITFFKEFLPKDVSKILIPFFNGKLGGNHILFMLIGFIVASNGPHAIILASNALYGVENSDPVKRRIKAFILTILLVTVFLVVLVGLAFGDTITKYILNLEVFKNVSNTLYYIFAILKWPIAFLVIYVFVKLLYTLAPDKKITSRSVNKGAALTTIGWTIITAIYSYYVGHLANYTALYGSLSSIAILMMWTYIISYILVLGIIVNSREYEKMEENGNNKIEEIES